MNILGNSRVPETRREPKLPDSCESTFSIILPPPHTIFSQNHLTEGDLNFPGKKYAFSWVFWGTYDKNQKSLLNQSTHICKTFNFPFVWSQLIFFSICSCFCCSKCLGIRKPFKTFYVPLWDPLEWRCTPYETGMVTEESAIIFLTLLKLESATHSYFYLVRRLLGVYYLWSTCLENVT